jgi:hypothetical protein
VRLQKNEGSKDKASDGVCEDTEKAAILGKLEP